MVLKRTNYFSQIQNGTLLHPPDVFNSHISAALRKREIAMRKTVAPVPNQRELSQIVTYGVA